ncbi:hypothetical protein WQO_14180 [Streptomyces globisporus C-1027]|uniref:Uncharacterized protein n=1 Tax=Streptomyces globisporus C-1027 TaxID=1172567 RepID=A0A0U3MCR7_STRGL|nr:hypothetical protein [Streptomyces globisporus]ALU94399.1 hypothetical protein WQO_14180 [Streptomyces globisporus C-1027]
MNGPSGDRLITRGDLRALRGRADDDPEGLFARLDKALDEGNGEALQTVVRGIVDIAKSSPLVDIGDLSQVRAALDDPVQVWEL